MKKFLVVIATTLTMFSCSGALQPAFASNVSHDLKPGRHVVKFVKHHHVVKRVVKHHVVKHTKRKVK